MLGVEDTVTEQCLERGLTRGCLCSGTATGSRQTQSRSSKKRDSNAYCITVDIWACNQQATLKGCQGKQGNNKSTLQIIDLPLPRPR